eukprot:TRINITY_DN6596_c0_g1_i1.p1 TRINITY_DN6596_c0_g1~~TRINITY_DN6596_c0_g1_i1.p1  ORF type:complete len:236 (+),score=23.88 TRINITY_DN6596_c0_g1_i1:38-709(+)
MTASYMQLLNLPVFDQLVIDIRSSDDYAVSTCLTACSMPVAIVEAPESWHQRLLAILAAHVDSWGLPDKFKAICVLQYGAEMDDPAILHAQNAFIEWLSQAVLAMHQDGGALVPAGYGMNVNDTPSARDNSSARWLQDLQSKLQFNRARVLALPDGFADFAARMPYFIGPPGTGTAHIPTLPSCLHPQVKNTCLNVIDLPNDNDHKRWSRTFWTFVHVCCVDT